MTNSNRKNETEMLRKLIFPTLILALFYFTGFDNNRVTKTTVSEPEVQNDIRSFFLKHLAGIDVNPEEAGDIDLSPESKLSAEELKIYTDGSAENDRTPLPYTIYSLNLQKLLKFQMKMNWILSGIL